MAKAKSINVNILVDEAHKDDLQKVASALQKKGFSLKKSMDEIGVLAGSVPDTKLAALSKVAGVSAVEEERTDYRTQES